MHSIISIVGIVLTGKENFPDWSRMIQHTLIFNELWKGVCAREGDSDPEKPTSDKELAIWENKNNKAYALILASLNKEVSRHISSYSTAFEYLQKLKELYDSHSALEVVQLMIKLFTLELQNNAHLPLASEIKSIMHDIKSTKFVEREKDFGKKTSPESSEETACLDHKEKYPAEDSTRGRGGRRGRGRYFRGRGGRHSQGEKADLHCIRGKRNGSHDASTCKLPWDKIEQRRNQQKGKTDDTDKGKAPESDHYVEAQCNIEVNEDLFNTSLSSWKNDWLLDSGATCHLTHRKEFFEDFTDNVDGVVYFAYQSKIKPLGLGTIRLKLRGLSEFLLDHVLYLPQLKRNLLSLVHIFQQGHSIHMFDGKLEVRKAFDHSLVMRGIEEERLFKLQGTSAHAQHFSYISHHEEGTLPSSLLWHVRFGHLNYDSLCLLKKNGVAGLPTIPKNLSNVMLAF
eukprot:PITA_20188